MKIDKNHLIYTRTGDKGRTSLAGGVRVSKSTLRVEACGAVDELDAHLGLLAANLSAGEKKQILEIQQQLFVINGFLAVKSDVNRNLSVDEALERAVCCLENEINVMNEQLPPLTNFIIPGGCVNSAQCHVCRTVCRRAERRIVKLAEKSAINPSVLKYINRLSDFLYVLARFFNKINDSEEIFVQRSCR